MFCYLIYSNCVKKIGKLPIKNLILATLINSKVKNMKIYHNPRCSKSRQGLAILKDAKVDFEIIEYLKTPPTEKEIKGILTKLQIEPIDLVRKNEAIWKENYKGKELSNDQIIKAMAENPKLIERPIVIHNNKAVLGRPPENISSLI